MIVAGNIIISIGLVFMALGVIGMFKYRNFFTRILIASKIDTVGTLTVLLGIAIRTGFNFTSLRILLLLALMFIISPMVNHIIVSSAYKSGLDIDQAQDEQEDNL